MKIQGNLPALVVQQVNTFRRENKGSTHTCGSVSTALRAGSKACSKFSIMGPLNGSRLVYPGSVSWLKRYLVKSIVDMVKQLFRIP